MPIEWEAGDESHPFQAEVRPPEAYLLIQALDAVQASADNKYAVRLAFLVQMTTSAEVLQTRYRHEPAEVFAAEGIGEPPTEATEQFWIGSAALYSQVRARLEMIAQRPATEQRTLLTYAIELAPTLRPYADQIDGIAAWGIIGAK